MTNFVIVLQSGQYNKEIFYTKQGGKTMNKKISNLLFLLFLAITIHSNTLSWDVYSLDKNLFVGNILFPQSVSIIPQICLYQRGTKIQTETDNSGKKIQFTVSENKKHNKLHFLITQYAQPKMENNIVTGLKVGRKQNYKLFRLKFINQNRWNIREKKLESERIIPDDTLIIIFNPNYVEKVDGGNSFELPKVLIKENILELAGSEKKLHNEVNELLMASLDLNTLHIKPTSEIKSDHKKKLVIAMSTPE